MNLFRYAHRSVVPTIAAVTAAATLSMVQPAAAAPASPALSSTALPQANSSFSSDAAPVQNVQYRGGRHYRGGWHGRPHYRHRHWGGHRRHWRGYGPGIAAGAIASAIIGGTIIASQRDHRDAWDRCADTYRSFSWSDGTFQPYGDEPRRLCPYLAH